MLEIFNSTMCDMVREVFRNHIICLDDGHGWFTPGKRSFTVPPFHENEFNSIVEGKLLLFLDYCGIEHYQLSPGSIDTELGKRDQYEHKLVKDAKSRGKKAISVSIHCDAFEDPNDPGQQNSAHGFCVYYYGRGTKFSIEGRKIARNVAEAIIQSDKRNGHIVSPRHDYGISPADFFVLREFDSPTILIENGFMTSNNDLKLLQSDRFRNHRALAILQGLYQYIKF